MIRKTGSAKNLLLSLVPNDAEIGSRSSDCEDEMVEKSPSKNLNKAITYLTLNARQVFTKLR